MAAVDSRFFQRPADQVARDLLGRRLVSTIGDRPTGGIITETEAYLGVDDPASHAYRGRRHVGNLAIYGPPGSWYVYRSYGIHWCINLVTTPDGNGSAVLIRGLLADTGPELIAARRAGAPRDRLTNGPGKVAQALGIDRELDGRMMVESRVRILEGTAVPDDQVDRTPRVGISKAVEWPLRFLVKQGSGKRGNGE